MIIVMLVAVTSVCWYQAIAHRVGTGVDPKTVIAITGEPVAVVSVGGLVITASAAGHVSAFDAIRRRLIAQRQLNRPVESLAVRGSSIFALGDGRIMRMSPTLQVGASRRVRHVDRLAVGPAGVWGAGGGWIVRINPSNLRVSARVRVRGRIDGLAVSTSSVWATATRRSRLLVLARGRGRRFVVRSSYSTPAGPGPLVIARGRAWVLCVASRQLAGYELRDPRMMDSRPVGLGATLLAEGNTSLYVGSPVTDTVTQYGLANLKRAGRPISVAGLPSAIVVDLHALWVASAQESSLVRIDLAELALQRRRVTRHDTWLGVAPEVYLVLASALTVLLLQAALAWRSSDPDAGLPRHELRDVCVIALDVVRWSPLSDGRIDTIERSTARQKSAQIGVGSRSLAIGHESGEIGTSVDVPPDRGIRQAIARLMRTHQVKHFPGYVPSAGALLRTPRSWRMRPARVHQRFLALEPYTVCLLSGTFAVSRPDADTVNLQLRQLIDRRWCGWEAVDVARDAWLTVECAATAFTELGLVELAEHHNEIRLQVLAVPSPRGGDDEALRMQLVVAYYHVSI